MEKQVVLSVRQLHKQFKSVKALNDISFNVEKGDIFAFLGPNGAGKTTTLRILLDVIRPDSGEVSWNLHSKKLSTPNPNDIGYLPEERGLYTDLPVIKSLVYLATIRGMHPQEAKKSASEWLEKLGLESRAKEKLQTLSKGNQQKIQFVASILHKPSFAILDEPFSGFDPVNQEQFIGYIKDLNASGTTILLSSHQMMLVEKIANKVFFINQGTQVFNGPISDVYKYAQTQNVLTVVFNREITQDLAQNLPHIERVEHPDSRSFRLYIEHNADLNETLGKLATLSGITGIRSEIPGLHELFLQFVKTA